MRRIKKKIGGLAVSVCIILGISACGKAVVLPDLSQMGEITVVSREEGSGTRSEFENQIDTDAKGTTLIADSTENLISLVEKDKNAIGYASLSSMAKIDNAKVVSIDGVYPDEKSIQNGKYKLCREYILAYDSDLSQVEQDFLSYVMQAGQKVVSEYAVSVKNESTFLSDKSKGTIVIHGSTSMKPLMDALSEDYKRYNPNAEFQIVESDSSTGLTDAMQNKCGFAMSSRSLKNYEKELLEETTIAKDAIAVIVNADNPAEELSMTHVKQIYNKSVKKWTELK